MLEGSKIFWETNYKQNIAKMISICYRYTHDQQIAEDLAHDAFLLAIDKSSSFENKGAFEAWLRRIVVNVSLQYLREHKKQKLHESRIAYATDLIEHQDERQNNEDPAFTKTELLEVIKLLPEHHRLVFNLYVIDHFTHAQIATELGISEGTSKSHLARARKKIRELLDQRLREQKKRKPAFLLFILPVKFWNVDHFFTEQFSGFNLTPAKNNAKIHLTAGGAGAVLALISFLYFNQQIKAPVIVKSDAFISNPVSDLSPQNNLPKKNSSRSTTSATFSKNDIIPIENNKTMKEMKNLKNLGTLLMVSSVLALDTPNLWTADTLSLLKKTDLPLVLKERPMTESAKLDPPRPFENKQIETKIKRNLPPLSGTLYASSVSWSSPNNSLILKGNKVRVNLKTQKFIGDGTFSFVDHVDYISVDGVPLKLNETIKLMDKKYRLNQLTENEATKKYGERVKSAIEIALVQ